MALAVLLALLISAPLAAAAQSLDQLRLPPFYKGYVHTCMQCWNPPVGAFFFKSNQDSIRPIRSLTVGCPLNMHRPPTEAPLVRARAMGAALGAWLGATLIPLDWAMPFQVKKETKKASTRVDGLTMICASMCNKSTHQMRIYTQEYPLPPVAGAVVGHNLGALGWCIYEQLLSPAAQQQRRVRLD